VAGALGSFSATLGGDARPFAGAIAEAEAAGAAFAARSFAARVRADLAPFWAAVRAVNGDTVATAYIDVYRRNAGTAPRETAAAAPASVGTARSGGGNSFYGPVYLQADSTLIADEVSRQLAARG